MAYFMTTALGRDVPAGDWEEYRKDQVLALLDDFARNPFNDGTLHFSLTSICNGTSMNPAEARQVADKLVAEGLAEEPMSTSFRITPLGMRFVRVASVNPLLGYG